MRKRLHAIAAFTAGALLAIGLGAFAQDWYEASGKPVQRSLLNSGDLRTEFASIQNNIADKLPVLTGNGGKVVAINSGGTALESIASVPVASGGTGAITASGARTNLGLAIGTDVQAFDAQLADIAGLTPADSNFVIGNGTNFVLESGSTARTSLGLGSLAILSSVNNSNWSGTDLSVTNGGTGSSTASDARTALGVAIGSDVQGFDAQLADVAGLAVTDGNFIVGNGLNFVAESGATARTSLGLGSLATANTINGGNWSGTDLALADGGTGSSTASGARTNLGLAIGSDVQAFDADLSAIAALANTNSNFIVGNGTAWVAETGSTARASLGLGSLATLSSINDSNWSGTDLAVANGGTGASDAGTARTNLGAAATSHNHSADDITSGTLAVGRGGTGQTTMDNVSEQVWLQCTIESDPGGTPTGSPGDCFLYY